MIYLWLLSLLLGGVLLFGALVMTDGRGRFLPTLAFFTASFGLIGLLIRIAGLGFAPMYEGALAFGAALALGWVLGRAAIPR
ncbi:MAG: hypothetical protein AAGF12_11335 [Myxococcota bacterium]